jgi:hypothetical protein
MRTVDVYEIRTALPEKEIALLFRERIIKPQSKGLRLVAGKFTWSFYTPTAADGPFAQFETRGEEPSFAVAAHAVRPERGGMVRQAADALATGNFLLETWDRGARRDVRLTAPPSTAWKSDASNFLNGLVEKDPGAGIEQSVQRVSES